MSILTTKLTADDLDQFPDDGKRREIIDGDLYVSPAPSAHHQVLLGELFVRFRAAVSQKQRGVVYLAPFDVHFSPSNQVQPDLIITLDTAQIGENLRRLEHAPDIVLEILSPSSTHYDAVEKAQLYARFGVPEYWVVTPPDLHAEGRVGVQVFTLSDGVYREQPADPDGICHSRLLPDLAIDPATLLPIKRASSQ